MTMRLGLTLLAAAVVATAAGPVLPQRAAAAPKKHCRWCGPPWFYPEPESEAPSLPHGFALTVAVGSRDAREPAPVRLERFADVGHALGACWAPSAEIDGAMWRAVTIRVAFRRDGSVFGLPRIPFADAQSPQGRAALAQSLLASLKRCTPLAFSPALGAAVAGEIFAIRFTNEDRT